MARSQSAKLSSQTQDKTISIRVHQSQRDLIDRAAEALGKNRSDFMLETACQAAESVLLERRFFNLADEEFNEFLEILDQPPLVNEKLSKLLLAAAPWE